MGVLLSVYVFPKSVARTDDASDDPADHGSTEGNPSRALVMAAVMGCGRRRFVVVWRRRGRMVRDGCAVRGGSGVVCASVTAIGCWGFLMRRRFLGRFAPAVWRCECCSAESHEGESGDQGLRNGLVHVTLTFLGFLPLHRVRGGCSTFLTNVEYGLKRAIGTAIATVCSERMQSYANQKV